jgi:flagellar basal-body rod protein FlgF
MDRSLFIAMNAAQQTMLAQATTANNLANVNTTGFRADYEQFRSLPVFGEGVPSRAFSMTERTGTDFKAGRIQATGRELDFSIQGDGFFAVVGRDGQEGYTRAGHLSVNANGQLVTGTGLQVIGEGGPIAIPPASKVDIGQDGTISVRPIGEAASALAVLDRIKLVNPDPAMLFKDNDGLIRMTDGSIAPFDASMTVASGTLETRNVNAVGSLVRMIELQRQYETQIQMMKTTQENSSVSTRLMQLGG